MSLASCFRPPPPWFESAVPASRPALGHGGGHGTGGGHGCQSRRWSRHLVGHGVDDAEDRVDEELPIRERKSKKGKRRQEKKQKSKAESAEDRVGEQQPRPRRARVAFSHAGQRASKM
jgi:hypothetical protein